jgi:hypothetical protein
MTTDVATDSFLGTLVCNMASEPADGTPYGFVQGKSILPFMLAKKVVMRPKELPVAAQDMGIDMRHIRHSSTPTCEVLFPTLFSGGYPVRMLKLYACF